MSIAISVTTTERIANCGGIHHRHHFAGWVPRGKLKITIQSIMNTITLTNEEMQVVEGGDLARDYAEQAERAGNGMLYGLAMMRNGQEVGGALIVAFGAGYSIGSGIGYGLALLF